MCMHYELVSSLQLLRMADHTAAQADIGLHFHKFAVVGWKRQKAQAERPFRRRLSCSAGTLRVVLAS